MAHSPPPSTPFSWPLSCQPFSPCKTISTKIEHNRLITHVRGRPSLRRRYNLVVEKNEGDRREGERRVQPVCVCVYCLAIDDRS